MEMDQILDNHVCWNEPDSWITNSTFFSYMQNTDLNVYMCTCAIHHIKLEMGPFGIWRRLVRYGPGREDNWNKQRQISRFFSYAEYI